MISMDKDISVVIPAYNEEKIIEQTVKKIREYLSSKGFSYEIIAVNDGSSDRTEEILIKLKNEIEELKVINHKENMGKGRSVKDGVLNSLGELILFTDADLSAPIENLDGLIEELKKGYDVVIASREIEGAKVRKRTLIRRVLSKVFNLAIKIFGFKGFRDTQCGFKLFKSTVAQFLFLKSRINGYAFDVEILHIAEKRGYKIKEYPILWIDRKDSKMRLFKDGLRMLKEVIKIRYYDWKGYYI